jgi:hypothetical protein
VAQASSEFGYSSRERIWSKLNKCLGVLIALGIVIPLAYRSLPVVKEKAAQDKRLAELETKIEGARMQHRRLVREVEMLQAPGGLLELYVRDRLDPGFMKPGETIMRMDRKSGP